MLILLTNDCFSCFGNFVRFCLADSSISAGLCTVHDNQHFLQQRCMHVCVSAFSSFAQLIVSRACLFGPIDPYQSTDALLTLINEKRKEKKKK